MGGAERHEVGGTWQSVDDRHLTNDCARAEKGENAFLPGARYHRDLEQPILNAIAAVAGIAGKKQHLVGLEPYRRRTAKKARQKMFGQTRQQALICRAYRLFPLDHGPGRAHGYPPSTPHGLRSDDAEGSPFALTGCSALPQSGVLPHFVTDRAVTRVTLKIIQRTVSA